MMHMIRRCLVPAVIATVLVACTAAEEADVEPAEATSSEQALTRTFRPAQTAGVTKSVSALGGFDLGKIINDDYKKNICWRGSYPRGAGAPLSTCPGAEKDGALCYPGCSAGYDGVGPVCWENCPAGYADDGATCRRDAHIFAKPSYGRGVGSIPWGGCGSDKEYDAGLCYTKCQAGYHGVGPVCWGTCPAGYADDGGTCRRDAHIFGKKSYGRGAGSPMSCAPGQQQDAGLCYTPCTSGWTGVGPVCWRSSCPADFPVACAAGCAKDAATCAKATADQTLQSLELLGKLIEQDWGGAISAGVAAANTFNIPICKD